MSVLSEVMTNHRHVTPGFGSPAPDLPQRASAPFWGAIVIRIATAADRLALEQLAEIDSAERPDDPTLIAELRGRPVAALSLTDGEVIADPFVATADLVDLLRLRGSQLSSRGLLRRRH